MKPGISISSYDVFDTVLTRRVCDPKAVFYFVGREARSRGLLTLTPDAFRKTRAEAESLGRVDEPDGEVDINRIYKILGRMTGCAEPLLEEVKRLEMDWERRMITAMPGAKAALGLEREAGRQIHFISEMYALPEFLESLLREQGLMQNGDKLWVSNEHQASKRTGKLYSIFLSKARLGPDQVQHYGNDWSADVAAARRMGMNAVHQPEGNPTADELLLERHSQGTNGWTSLMAGAARLVRLRSQQDARKDGLRRIMSGVVCPTLTCYVLWVLQRARALGLRRLYFVSRDGYVPFLLARHIAATLLPGLECRYLYGSRQAWHLAGLRELDDAAAQWITGSSDGATCASILRRLDLSWEEVGQILPALAGAMGQPERPFGEQEREALKTALQSDPCLSKAVMARSRRKHALLTRYLAQEDVLRDVPTGMVEIGWSGRTRASLESCLAGYNLKNMHWLYLGLHHRVTVKDPERVHYFLYGPEIRRPEILCLPVVVESFCLAPHGSVMGYREEGNKMAPVFRGGVEKQLEQWGRTVALDTVQEYLQHLLVDAGSFPEIGDTGGAAYDLLTRFCGRPSTEEGRIWGSIPFEHDQAGENALPLAPEPRLNWAAIKSALIFGGVDRACMGEAEGVWGAGSWAARRRILFPLTLAASAGYVRVHWRKISTKIGRRIVHLFRK